MPDLVTPALPVPFPLDLWEEIMGGVRIPHDLTGEDRFILGLSVSRVAILLFGSLSGYTMLRLQWPLALRLIPALATWAATAAFVWLRPGGQSLATTRGSRGSVR